MSNIYLFLKIVSHGELLILRAVVTVIVSFLTISASSPKGYSFAKFTIALLKLWVSSNSLHFFYICYSYRLTVTADPISLTVTNKLEERRIEEVMLSQLQINLSVIYQLKIMIGNDHFFLILW